MPPAPSRSTTRKCETVRPARLRGSGAGVAGGKNAASSGASRWSASASAANKTSTAWRSARSVAPSAARWLARLASSSATSSSKVAWISSQRRESIRESVKRFALELEREPGSRGAQLSLRCCGRDPKRRRTLLQRQAPEIALLEQLALPRAHRFESQERVMQLRDAVEILI